MNERIKQAADLSRSYKTMVVDGILQSVLVIDPERFAQLIVRECIKTITEYDLIPGHSAKWEDIYDIHTRLLQDLGLELKEHFGVEE